jgi:STE24 endopeptidase
LSQSHDACPPERPESPGLAELESSGLSADELAEAKRYGRQGLYCDLADRAIDIAYLAPMALLVAPSIDVWLGRCPVLGNWWTLRLAAMLLIVVGLHIAVSFPLSFYSGHVLEHRYGLSKQTLGGWLWRYAKRNVLAVAFGLALFTGLFWLIWLCGAWWWLVAAGAFFVVSVVLGQLAPVVIMPLFYKIERLDQPELAERLAHLTEGTGLSIEGVYRMDLSAETAKGNAMLAGLGRTRRVILGDTLLDQFTLDELEVIFAHEIGHHVFRHIRKLILAGLVYSAAGFWICDRLLAAWVAGPGGTLDYAQLPIYTLPLVMLILTVFTNVIEPLQNAISRRYERQSDRYALDRTGLRAAYVSAFQKLARLNKDDPDPHWLESLLFHSHPPIAQRLAMAEMVSSK